MRGGLPLRSARMRWDGSSPTGMDRTGVFLNKAKRGLTHPKVTMVIYGMVMVQS